MPGRPNASQCRKSRAGSDAGGKNGHGLTYANPIRVVLEALGVELVT